MWPAASAPASGDVSESDPRPSLPCQSDSWDTTGSCHLQRHPDAPTDLELDPAGGIAKISSPFGLGNKFIYDMM